MKTTLQSNLYYDSSYYELGEETFNEIKSEILHVLKSHGVSLAQAKNIFEIVICAIEETPLKDLI